MVESFQATIAHVLSRALVCPVQLTLTVETLELAFHCDTELLETLLAEARLVAGAGYNPDCLVRLCGVAE
jgi:hypothetical protein